MDRIIIRSVVNILLVLFLVSFLFLTIQLFVPDPEIKDVIYNQANSYYYLELFDPIYFSYGFEYDNIQRLDFDTGKYSSCSDYSIDLFPDNFYKQLEKTNELYITYYNNPNHETAHDVINQQRETALAYIDDNERFLKSLTDIDEETTFSMTNGKFITLAEVREYINQNIFNGYNILEELQQRQIKLHRQEEYNLLSAPSVSLSMSNNIDKQYLLDDEQALELLRLYVVASKDDISTQKKVSKYSTDDLFLAEIPLTCENNIPENVYGVDDDFYAHMFYGDYDGDINIVEDYETRGELYMPIASCNCPYSEEDRVNWYLIKHIHEDIEKNGFTEYENYERKFLHEPTYKNVLLLSDVYEKELKNSFYYDTKNEDHLLMWKRMNKINTKFFLIDELLDDINLQESSKYFNTDAKNICDEYQNYVIVESMYHLTFMQWSDAVFRDDVELPYDDDTSYEIFVSVEIDDNKKFINDLLEKDIS